ncbi:hypothetical protein HA402_015188 [Bradysia odoriphaga]|nr:hypothetical protein HA402_015188 [Bradysia odoriphaga]
MFKITIFPMYLTMFAVMLAAVVGHTDCHLSNSEQTTNQMSIELINSKPLHAINVLAISCIPPYDIAYCLNGGRCFNVTFATYSMPSCECATGFMGEKCEYKYLDRSYNPEHYMKADDTITSEHWSNREKSHEQQPNSFNNIAGVMFVGSGAVKGVSVTISVVLLAMLLLHLLIFVLVAV